MSNQEQSTTTPDAPAATDESQILSERRQKLRALRASGQPAYPNDVRPSHRAEPLHERYASHSRETLESEHVAVAL
ncbi:MAG: lysine--tRNA ligase, partial [Burkholderiaceae bacterium]